jgi:hypothetical protein
MDKATADAAIAQGIIERDADGVLGFPYDTWAESADNKAILRRSLTVREPGCDAWLIGGDE